MATLLASVPICGGLPLKPRDCLFTRSSLHCSTVPLTFQRKPNQPKTKRSLSVCAEYGNQRGGSGGDFVTGFLIGSAIFGTLGYVFAPQHKFKNVTFCVGQKQVMGTHWRRSVLSVQCRKRLEPICALESDISKVEAVELEKDEKFEQWDSWTAKFSGASNLPFLLLQLPQIILNARNLMAGNPSALLAIPWLGMLTGLLGNMSLLSYFVKKRETEVVVVQTLGVVSIYAVITQLAIAEAMPFPYFVVISAVVASCLLVNFMKYFNFLNDGVWRLWEDFITIGGLSALPQVMWSTFIPYVPNTILPGSMAFVLAAVAVIMARMGKLSEKGTNFVGSISGWTATLLFMWMPVAQTWTNFLNPENIKGLSAVSMLLAMIGNGLMIPRALFIRDLMWFTGSSWASVFYGWGNLICLYCFNSISKEFFLAATLGLFSWIGFALWSDTRVYGYNSPLRSLKELVFGP